MIERISSYGSFPISTKLFTSYFFAETSRPNCVITITKHASLCLAWCSFVLVLMMPLRSWRRYHHDYRFKFEPVPNHSYRAIDCIFSCIVWSFGSACRHSHRPHLVFLSYCITTYRRASYLSDLSCLLRCRAHTHCILVPSNNAGLLSTPNSTACTMIIIRLFSPYRCSFPSTSHDHSFLQTMFLSV